MLSSEVMRPARSTRLSIRFFAALTLGAALLAGCQAQPLYGNLSGQERSVTVSRVDSRIEQVVRNELVLGFGGEQAAGAYTLDLTASASISGILPGGVDNEFSAARTTVTAYYVLKATGTGETIKSGVRSAEAQLDLPSQNFAQERAKLEAETRAARAVAALVRVDVASVLPR